MFSKWGWNPSQRFCWPLGIRMTWKPKTRNVSIILYITCFLSYSMLRQFIYSLHFISTATKFWVRSKPQCTERNRKQPSKGCRCKNLEKKAEWSGCMPEVQTSAVGVRSSVLAVSELQSLPTVLPGLIAVTGLYFSSFNFCYIVDLMILILKFRLSLWACNHPVQLVFVSCSLSKVLQPVWLPLHLGT